MSIHVLAIGLLVLMFAIAIARPINIGAMALVFAFSLSTYVLDLPIETVMEVFPVDLFVMLVGVTYLFAIAQNNGTVDHLIAYASNSSGNSRLLAPWIMFLITVVITGLGGVAPAVIAMLMPVAMTLARAYNIRPILMGLMVCMGCTAGSFSPIGIFGITVNGVLAKNELPSNPGVLAAATFATAAAVAAIIFGVFIRDRTEEDGRDDGGPQESADRSSRQPDTPAPLFDESAPSSRVVTAAEPQVESKTLGRKHLSAANRATLLGFLLLPIGSLIFDIDAGFVALSIAVVLTIILPTTGKSAINDVSWPVVLLVTGVVTYIGVMQEAGTIDWVAVSLAGVGSAVITALLVCFTGAVVSAFASTTGILGALVPLAVPVLATGEIGVLGLIIALSLSSSLVDFSPFSGAGAMLIANSPAVQRDRVYRQLLLFCGAMVVLAPVLTWLIFVISPSSIG